MSYAHRQNEPPPNPSCSSSSAPVETSDVEVIGGESVPVIKLGLVHDSKEKMVDFPVDTIEVVDDFVMPNGYWREGAHERSLMYSLGVYTVPICIDTNDERHKYFRLPVEVMSRHTIKLKQKGRHKHTPLLSRKTHAHRNRP